VAPRHAWARSLPTVRGRRFRRPDSRRSPRRARTPRNVAGNPSRPVDTRPRRRRSRRPVRRQVFFPTRPARSGKFRYLLFDISATEKEDPFGNTFYSEIDVIDAAGSKRLEAAAPPVAEAISNSSDSPRTRSPSTIPTRRSSRSGGKKAPAHGRQVVPVDRQGPAERGVHGPSPGGDRHH